MKNQDILLDIANLCVEFHVQKGVAKVINNLDLQIKANETLGIVGESGCGKSMTALAVLGMVPAPGKIATGSITYQGEDLTRAGNHRLRQIRGNDITMIFQEPMTSLNPVYTAGEQIAETLRHHRKMGRKHAMQTAVSMLQAVSIPSPDRVARQFPHELSGGMRQRVVIAMALACAPDLLIADEPTTALDVTIQAQILKLMNRLRKDFRASILLITHDLGVVAETAHFVAVMYAGRLVERADVYDLFARPLHPYTLGLMKSVPKLDKPVPKNRMLEAIPGVVPNPLELPPGCAFADRCPQVKAGCRMKLPPLVEVQPGHLVRCLKFD